MGHSFRMRSMQIENKLRSPAFLVCFLLSGAAGLIYEVVWSRQLALFVGITTYAHAAVITAYMLGLATGSLVIGRWCDRCRSPLRLYAWLEVATGLYAAATPWLCGWLQLVYVDAAKVAGITGPVSNLVRFFLVLLLLLPPTFCMGGTLPAMVKAMTRAGPQLAAHTARLYGINTLGAVLGALMAGYVLMPVMGLRMTIFSGVLINMLVAAIIFALDRKPARQEKGQEEYHVTAVPYETSRVPPVALFLFAMCGFAALTYQIAWTRSLTLVLGSSVYSFSVTLATFLAGIGLGSLLYEKLPAVRSATNPLRLASVAAGATGISAIISLWTIGQLPGLFLWGFQQDWALYFAGLQAFMFVMCFVVMLAPTLLMGLMFPLMVALWTRRHSSVGRDIGIVYAANTAGCILGSLSAGLVLLPEAGVHGAVFIAGGLHVLAGLGFGWLDRPLKSLTPGAVLLGVFVVLMLLLPAWDKALMTSGVFNYTQRRGVDEAVRDLHQRIQSQRMLYYRDGLDGTVSVLEKEGQRLLVINGKIDASSHHDLPTQVMIGQLPMLMHARPVSVLVIGLGSGITAGHIAQHASVKEIDILEISAEVVEASSWFEDENQRVLDDPRVRLVVADARNYLLGTDKKYDVIVTQPSNPWISGVANLFTREFFQLLGSRLNPGGVVCQWFHVYNMSPDDTKSVLRSYREALPHVSVWQSMNSDLIMVGTRQPHAFDARRLGEIIAQPEMLPVFQQINQNGLTKITKTFLLGDESLDDYCAGYPLNTDDRPRIEFNAPRYLYAQTTEKTWQNLYEHMEAHPSGVPVVNIASSTGRLLDVSTMGLVITTQAELTEDQWSADCKVVRQYFRTGPDMPDVAGAGSQVVVQWRDGSMHQRLKTFHREDALSVGQLGEYLGLEAIGQPQAGGEVDLPGGSRGAWVMTGVPGQSHITIWITWIAPSPLGGFIQYTVARDQQDPGVDRWGDALLSFARTMTPSRP